MKDLKEQFKNSYLKGCTAKATEQMSDYKYQWAKEMSHDEALVTLSGGGYVVIDKDDRLDNFPDTYFYDSNKPRQKDVFDLFKTVVESGAKDFQIVFQTDIRYWDSYSEKFSGESAIPTGDGTETLVLSTY